MSELILYDLPSKGHCACWSLNPWKTRLVLNYKSLPYKTKWLEYPAIAPTLQSFGLSPNAEGTAYTIPAMRFPDNTYVMDSCKIADELERRYPTPSLHLDSDVLPKVEELITRFMASMGGVLSPRGPDALLNEPSHKHFVDKIEKQFGMSMEQLEREKGGQQAWENAKPAVEELGRVLRAKGGPFVLGKEVSYADFNIVGFLRFLKRIGEDLYERMVKMEPALKTLYDASAVWLERDDH